jgi:hypothetical protein
MKCCVPRRETTLREATLCEIEDTNSLKPNPRDKNAEDENTGGNHLD